MRRRRFLQSAAIALAAASISPTFAAPASPTFTKLPRWRGFNLLEKFINRPGGNPPFAASDFEFLNEWGFDFVRMPMSYLCWSAPGEWLKIDEREIEHIDQAIEFGKKHGVHVNLNFHRAPGYCVNPPKEPLDLWSNTEALEACAFHWNWFAKRYRGISSERLSFDLLNEPADIPEETYARVVRKLVEGIRSADPERLIIADGLRWGRDPVKSLSNLQIAQSTRGYDPMGISHYQANWVTGSDKWPEPEWPLKGKNSDVWTRERLRQERIRPWKELEKMGVGVHVGEWGAFNKTPHAVALAWMRDQLDLWKEAEWGWAVWNLRGPFGVLGSERKDVAYEDWRGHKLDRQMLNLLRAG